MDNEEIAIYRNMARARPAPGAIVRPGPGQESVWDYPRPPRIEPAGKAGGVAFNGHVIASSGGLLKVVETASPPTYYFPPEDVDGDCLAESAHTTFCEWKGRATYWHVVVKGARIENAAWTYRDPLTDVADYTPLRGRVAFYPQQLDCTLGGQRIEAQQGRFYGGWISPDITGPFKGPPGTGNW